ncbi:MAG: DsrE family protein [Nitrospirota bacterium]|nr:DsrE family protein [Nitrospirota bacterium]
MAAESITLVIYSDPAKSGATAEALRMGMGLGVGERTLNVVLMGPAAQVLTDEVDDLVDGEMIENHLDVYADWGATFHVDPAAMDEYGIGDDSPVDVVPATAADVARLMAGAAQVMVFP